MSPPRIPEGLPPPSIALADLVVDQDPACARLGAAQRRGVARAAFAYGSAQSAALLPSRLLTTGDEGGRGCPTAAEAAVHERGVSIARSESETSAGMTFFADYSAHDRLITLYPRAISAYAHHLGLAEDLMEAVILTHELFHHLEATGCVDVFALPELAIPRICVGGRGFGRLRPRSASEAAAHGFAAELLRPSPGAALVDGG